MKARGAIPFQGARALGRRSAEGVVRRPIELRSRVIREARVRARGRAGHQRLATIDAGWAAQRVPRDPDRGELCWPWLYLYRRREPVRGIVLVGRRGVIRP